MKRYTLLPVALLALSLNAWGCSTEKKADPHAGHDHTAQDAAAAKTADKEPYPLDVCVVSGQKLGSMGDPVVLNHEGQTVKLCCAGCTAAFEKDPAKYIAKLDEAVAGKKADPHAGHNH